MLRGVMIDFVQFDRVRIMDGRVSYTIRYFQKDLTCLQINFETFSHLFPTSCKDNKKNIIKPYFLQKK